MDASLKEMLKFAAQESKSRGFRSVGIYHLMWAIHKLEPLVFDSWLEAYEVNPTPFIKMLENILRPRRAGGGIPRDQHEADLREEAIEMASKLAARRGEEPAANHLGEILTSLSEDPILTLCERFCLDCKKPVSNVHKG